MKTSIPTLILALSLAFQINTGDAFAQSQDKNQDKYDAILFMVIDKDFEKALSKAEKYTKRKASRKDPEPYLLMSMAYYEISKDESMREEFPRAFRDAVKYAYKGARYDKENEVIGKYDKYLTELKVELMREARFYYDEGSWRKSVTNAKYVTRIDSEDLPATLLKGLAEMKSRNEYQAKMTFEEAEKMAKQLSPGSFKSEMLPFLRFGIMEYATMMKENGEKDKAEPMLALGQRTFEDDQEFQNFVSRF